MAQIKEIVASRSIKINVGNYESVDHFVSMKMELDELDDEPKCADELAETVELAIARQVALGYKARGKKNMASTLAVAKHHGLGYVVRKHANATQS